MTSNRVYRTVRTASHKSQVAAVTESETETVALLRSKRRTDVTSNRKLLRTGRAYVRFVGYGSRDYITAKLIWSGPVFAKNYTLSKPIARTAPRSNIARRVSWRRVPTTPRLYCRTEGFQPVRRRRYP